MLGDTAPCFSWGATCIRFLREVEKMQCSAGVGGEHQPLQSPAPPAASLPYPIPQLQALLSGGGYLLLASLDRRIDSYLRPAVQTTRSKCNLSFKQRLEERQVQSNILFFLFLKSKCKGPSGAV